MSRLRARCVYGLGLVCLGSAFVAVAPAPAEPPKSTLQIPMDARGHQVSMALMENQQRLLKAKQKAPAASHPETAKEAATEKAAPSAFSRFQSYMSGMFSRGTKL